MLILLLLALVAASIAVMHAAPGRIAPTSYSRLT